jgi:hypothetical protein
MPTASPDAIVCRPTPWFLLRAAAMLLMFSFFAAYFAYDGAIGYRKKNHIFYLSKAFDEAVVQFNEKNKDNSLTAEEWKSFAATRNVKFPEDPYVLPKDLKQPMPWPEMLQDHGKISKRLQANLLWREYSAEHGYDDDSPEEPMTKREINEQWICAGVCVILSLVAAFFLLRTIRRRIVADETGITSQDGKRVAYADLKTLDLRKWDNKGLAFADYDGPSGKGRLRIDGLTYGGFKKEDGQPAEVLMERIRSKFSGEIIEFARAEEVSGEEPEPKTSPEDG